MQMLPGSIDPSTGLPALQSFVFAMKMAIAQAQRRGRCLAVQVLHVGVPTGGAGQSVEAGVRKVARLLQLANGNRGDLARLDDLLFAVILHDSDMRAARAHAESLRDAVAVYYAGECVPLRVSIGVACSPAHAHWNGRELLDRAMWRCVQAARSESPGISSSGHDAAISRPAWPSQEVG